MRATTHQLAEEYVRRLEHAARVLPRRDREELVAEIRNHVASGLPADASEADVRNLLDELGAPDDIVDAARPEEPATRPARFTLEIAALLVLAVGFILVVMGWLQPVLGWLPAAALILMSRIWSGSDKLLALVVLPFLAAAFIWFTTSPHLRTGEEIMLGLVLSAPFAAGYLGWRLRGRSAR